MRLSRKAMEKLLGQMLPLPNSAVPRSTLDRKFK